MKSLDHINKPIFEWLCPTVSFNLAGTWFVFMLAVLVAGCGGDGEQGATSSEDTASIVARTGPIIAARVGETPILDGSRSSTALSSPLSFSWSFSHKPETSKSKLQAATTENPSFIADVKGVYMVQLVVSANGIPSKRAIQTVVITLDGERLTGPFNHPGLSSECVSCHNGLLVDPGKSPDHIATSNMCQACHTPQGAAIIPFTDHLEVFGNCSECHNGITAIGKSEFHPPTNAECENCHNNTTSFLELAADGSFDHSNISRVCSGCHNGTVAIGKTPTPADTPPGTHPVTNTECGYCHTTVSFLGAYPDHTGPDVIGKRCDSCHDGGAGGAIGKNVGHVVTNQDCSTCHVSSTFTTAVFNHTGIVDNCSSCHDGITAVGKSLNHLPTMEDCSVCHITTAFIGARFDHTGTVDNCASCHDGLTTGGKSPDHNATSNKCEACHTSQDFAIIPFVNHLEVFGNCSECHNGITAIGKSIFHTPTNAECENCHNTTSFLELAADGSFDHSNIVRSCSGCHNGTVAIGKTDTAIHNVTNTECGYCHTTLSFLPAYPDHTDLAIIGNGCDSCHNGTTATGPSVGHPVTNVDCKTCHNIATFSLGGVFNHSLLASTVQSCESCHNDNTSINAPGKSYAVPTHIATNSDCGNCHNTDTFVGAFIDHTDPDVVGKSCDSCHGVTAIGKSLNHMPTSEDCSVCHTPGTFTSGIFSHGPGYIDPPALCVDCHNNVITVGKLINHLPTTEDCSVCHSTTEFANTTFNHQGIDTSNCALCHDENISIGKPLNHLPTILDCSDCHITNNFDSFAGITFNHLGIDQNNCASCHDTGIATPRTVNHIPAQDDCSVCHDSTAVFTQTMFLANVHQGITRGCEGCHVSQFLPTKPDLVKSAAHLPTVQDCYLCHTIAAFIPSIFAHTGITGNCVSCHDGNVNNVAVGARGVANTTIHQSTNEDCGTCHNTVNFADAYVDHTGPDVIDKRCDVCHDGGAGGAIGKNVDHVPTTKDCGVCHLAGGTFVPAVFDHTGIVDNCVSCHNGTDATGLTPAHLPTDGKDCSICHVTTAFAGANYDHTGIIDNCASCHNGVTASGKSPPPDHVPTNGDCSNCHQTTGFIPATFSHVGIVDNCSSCHDAGFATGKTDTHVPTSNDCGICHNTTTFIGAVFDHSGIVDNCASCHDGVTAIGKDAMTNPAHLETALDCHSCHTTATFIGGTWTHDANSAGQCDTCHSDAGGARSKPADHLSTNVQCDVCHSTNGWAPSIFSHTPGNYPGDHRIDPGCSGCHGNSVDLPFIYDFEQYAPFCAGCHARDFEPKGDHIGGENGTIEQNKNCASGGCHRVTDSEF